MENFERPIHYEAAFHLDKKEYPELAHAKVIVNDFNGKVTICVTALCYVYTKRDDGSFEVRTDQIGDYCSVNKDGTVAEFFSSLKEMVNRVSEMAKVTEGR